MIRPNESAPICLRILYFPAMIHSTGNLVSMMLAIVQIGNKAWEIVDHENEHVAKLQREVQVESKNDIHIGIDYIAK